LAKAGIDKKLIKQFVNNAIIFKEIILSGCVWRWKKSIDLKC